MSTGTSPLPSLVRLPRDVGGGDDRSENGDQGSARGQGSRQGALSTEVHQWRPLYDSARIDRKDQQEAAPHFLLPDVDPAGASVAPKIGAIEAAASLFGERRRPRREQKQRVKRWIGAGLATCHNDCIRRTPGHGYEDYDRLVKDPPSEVVFDSRERRPSTIEWGSSLTSRQRRNKQAALSSATRPIATAPVEPSHKPYDLLWLGGGPDGRWIVDARGRPRCVFGQVVSGNFEEVSMLDAEAPALDANVADDDEAYIQQQIFADDTSSFHQSSCGNSSAEWDEKQGAAEVHLVESWEEDEMPAEDKKAVSDLALSCHANNRRIGDVVPRKDRSRQASRRKQRFVSFGVVDGLDLRVHGSVQGVRKPSKAIEDVLDILQDLDRGDRRRNGACGRSRQAHHKLEGSVPPGPDEAVQAQDGVLPRSKRWRRPLALDEDWKGPAAARSKDTWRPKSLRNTWQWGKFRDILAQMRESTPAHGHTQATPTHRQRNIAPQPSGARVPTAPVASQEGALFLSESSALSLPRKLSIEFGSNGEEADSDDDGQSNPRGASEVLPTSAASVASSRTSYCQGNGPKHMSMPKIRAEAKRMKDALTTSAQKAFADDVWEECGIKSDHLRKHQIVAMISSGFRDSFKSHKEDDEEEEATADDSDKAAKQRRNTLKQEASGRTTSRPPCPGASHPKAARGARSVQNNVDGSGNMNSTTPPKRQPTERCTLKTRCKHISTSSTSKLQENTARIFLGPHVTGADTNSLYTANMKLPKQDTIKV